MERSVAEKLAFHLRESSSHLMQAVHLAHREMAEEERRGWIRGFGKALGELYLECIRPLEQDFPGLKVNVPDSDTASNLSK
jgi:hypothetical protein